MSEMTFLQRAVEAVNSVVWSPVLVVLLIAAGLYFSLRTRFVQVRRFRLMLRSLFGGRDERKDAKGSDGKRSGMSSFEAFCVAISGRVGTGNIVGVATAIALGGPGAVFWMWIIAFFGASTAFVEATLAQIYKFRHESGYRGGPFNYIEKGLGQRWLAVIFAIFTIVGYGILLVTVQANGMSTAISNSFGVQPLYVGIGTAVLLGLVIIGGVRSIARVATVVTPFMTVGYVLVALIVIGCHIDSVPAVLASIVTNAFGINPIAGGILGSTIMMGVKRGIFSNEAGQGGGAIVAAGADVPHPAKQGLAQTFSVYIDTLLVCTMTALMILCSGTYNIFGSDGSVLVANAPEIGANYVGFTQGAVDSVLHGWGGAFVSVALCFFAFSTVMAYYFYAETSIMYLFRGRRSGAEKWTVRAYKVAILAVVIFGAAKEADLVWQMGDIGVGLTTWVNVIVLFILCPKALEALRDYESR